MLGLRQNTNVLFGLTSYFIRKKKNIFNMFKKSKFRTFTFIFLIQKILIRERTIYPDCKIKLASLHKGSKRN